jgi:hypothetical protein
MRETSGFFWTVLTVILCILFVTAGSSFADGGCKQVCVKEGKKCVQYGQKCTHYNNQCARYQNQCIRYSRGSCTQYQQVCTQYKQVCTHYQQACVQEQTYCLQQQTVCPQQNHAVNKGKAYQQLEEIAGGKDSMFDGGPGSTLNRR